MQADAAAQGGAKLAGLGAIVNPVVVEDEVDGAVWVGSQQPLQEGEGEVGGLAPPRYPDQGADAAQTSS